MFILKRIFVFQCKNRTLFYYLSATVYIEPHFAETVKSLLFLPIRINAVATPASAFIFLGESTSAVPETENSTSLKEVLTIVPFLSNM